MGVPEMGYTPKLSSFNRTINHLISRYFIFIQTHTHTYVYIYIYICIHIRIYIYMYTHAYTYIYIYMIIDTYVHGYHMTWDIRLQKKVDSHVASVSPSSGRIEQLGERLKLTVTSSSRDFWMGNGDILGRGGYKYIHRYIHTHIRTYIYIYYVK